MARHRDVRGMDYDDYDDDYDDDYSNFSPASVPVSPSIAQYLRNPGNEQMGFGVFVPPSPLTMLPEKPTTEPDGALDLQGLGSNLPGGSGPGNYPGQTGPTAGQTNRPASVFSTLATVNQATSNNQGFGRSLFSNPSTTSSSVWGSNSPKTNNPENPENSNNSNNSSPHKGKPPGLSIGSVLKSDTRQKEDHVTPLLADKEQAEKKSLRLRTASQEERSNAAVEALRLAKAESEAKSPNEDSSASPSRSKNYDSKTGTPSKTPSKSGFKTPSRAETPRNYDIPLLSAKQKRWRDEQLTVTDAQKPGLNLICIGHVDAGKSTMMGHLLYLMGRVDKKTLHKYEKESKEMGKSSFHFAWILDNHDEEELEELQLTSPSITLTRPIRQSLFSMHQDIEISFQI